MQYWPKRQAFLTQTGLSPLSSWRSSQRTKRHTPQSSSASTDIESMLGVGYIYPMSLSMHRIVQIRSKVENSKVWESATRSVFWLILSMLSVFTAVLVMMVCSLFLFFYAPFLGIAACAPLVALLFLLRMLADEARRRENGT